MRDRLLAAWLVLVLGCDPPPAGDGGAPDGAPGDGSVAPSQIPPRASLWLERLVRGRPAPTPAPSGSHLHELAGHVAIVTPPASPETPNLPTESRIYDAIIQFIEPYRCAPLVDGSTPIRIVAPTGEEEVLTTEVRCDGTSDDVVFVHLPPTFLRTRIGAFLRVEIDFPADDEADTADGAHRVGMVALPFYVQSPAAISTSIGAPRVVGVEPSRVGPGWDREIRPSDEAALLAASPDALAAGIEPVPAHAQWVLESRRPTGSSMTLTPASLVHVGSTATPNDIGDGIVWRGRGVGETFDFGTGLSHLGVSATPVGMVPGQRYDVRWVGATGGLDPDGLYVPPTQDELGRFLVARAGSDVSAPVREMGARLVFDVHPIRIESPRSDRIAGHAALHRSPDGEVDGLRVTVIAPPSHPELAEVVAYEATMVVRSPASEQTFTANGSWPLDAGTDPNVITELAPYALPQAGRTWTMERGEIRIPFGDADVTASSVEVRLRLVRTGPSSTDPEDVVEARADWISPATPPPGCTDAGGECTRIIDTDERDCRLDQVCLPADADTRFVRVTLCGVTVSAELHAEPRPAALGGGMWSCTGPIDAGSGAVRRRPPGAEVGIQLEDHAGNVSELEDIVPPCFVAERRPPIPRPSRFFSHARDALGRPVIITADASTLDLWHWDGTTWVTTQLARHDLHSYRGRIDSVRLEDGTVAFCATYRRTGPNGGSVLWDLYTGEGRLEIGLLRRDGTVTVLDAASPVKALGCGIDARGDRIAVAYTADVRAEAVSAIPAVIECDIRGGALACDRSRTFPLVRGHRGLGLDPDVAIDPTGRVFVSGRGLQAPGMPRETIEEHSVYVIAAAHESDPRHRISVPVRQIFASDEALDGCAARNDSGTITIFPPENPVQRGATQPRLFAPTGSRRVVFFQHYEQTVEVFRHPASARCIFDSRVDVAVAVQTGAPEDEWRTSAVVPIHEGSRMPPQPMFRVGTASDSYQSKWPPLRFPRYPDPEPETMPGFDVEDSIVGLLYQVAFQRRWVGDDDGLALGSSTRSAYLPTGGTSPESDDPSSTWVAEVSIGSGRGILRAKRRIDVETGFERNTGGGLSLWVDHGDRIPTELSVVYDRHFGRAHGNFRDVLYADSRAGQFVDRPSERGAPTAWTLPTPIDTCWRAGDTRVQIDPDELNLVPDPPQGSWTSPRAETLITMTDTPEHPNPHRSLTGMAECGLSRLVQEQDGDFTREEAIAFNDEVREPIVGRLLGTIENLRKQRPAMIMSTRHLLIPRFGPGDLIIQAGAVTWTGRLETTDLLTLGGVVRELNGRFEASGSGAATSPPVLSVYDHARLTIALDAPTMRVADTPLARELGLPIERESSTTWVDVANGDEDDRFTPCREPCGNDGTGAECERPRDCFPPATSLVDIALDDVLLRLGRPPLRRGQEGICLPRLEEGDVHRQDVCLNAHDSSGTHISFPSTGEAAIGPGRCAPGASLFENPSFECTRCGHPYGDEGLFDAIPRRCNDHNDCNVNVSCFGAACEPSVTSYLCTQRDVEFMGLPRGTGFCARPTTACSSARLINVDVSGASLARTPPPPLRVCRSLFDYRGDGDLNDDFEPAAVECAVTACVECLGTRPNGYCAVDRDCPRDHVCLRQGIRGVDQMIAPACLLRPFLSDPRLDDVRDALDNATDLAQPVAVLANPIVNQIDSGTRSMMDTLAFAIPRRIVGREATGTPTDHADPDFMTVALDSVFGTLQGAEIVAMPDPDGPVDFPGAGDLIVDVYIASPGIRVGFRAAGQLVVAGVSHGIDSDIVIDVQVQAIRLRLRPIVRYVGGAPTLGFRGVGMELIAERDPERTLQVRDITLVSSSQTDDWMVAIRVLFLGILHNAMLPAILEMIDIPIFEGLSPDLSSLSAIGGLYQLVAEQPFVGAAIFDEEAVPMLLVDRGGFAAGFSSSRLEGVAIETSSQAGSLVEAGAWDGRERPFAGLGLHYRGPRSQIFRGTAHTLRCRTCSDIGVPDPNCIEGADDSTCGSPCMSGP